MATDGVKIIDGDAAHDTYWGIIDLFDSGANIETIRKKYPFPQPQEYYYDDLFCLRNLYNCLRTSNLGNWIYIR